MTLLFLIEEKEREHLLTVERERIGHAVNIYTAAKPIAYAMPTTKPISFAKKSRAKVSVASRATQLHYDQQYGTTSGIRTLSLATPEAVVTAGGLALPEDEVFVLLSQSNPGLS
ncbi:hypothetical protein EVAR_34694_1 [Eumeta japonica]|uniref:Uncharacterized protein n=1 Tax=Eumeta variegata TaxID=151549 RepID=A0A4C1XGN4_EUMVA|nr:hypothetical protein EVAR_34694_1 [Eumeta japonica]